MKLSLFLFILFLAVIIVATIASGIGNSRFFYFAKNPTDAQGAIVDAVAAEITNRFSIAQRYNRDLFRINHNSDHIHSDINRDIRDFSFPLCRDISSLQQAELGTCAAVVTKKGIACPKRTCATVYTSIELFDNPEFRAALMGAVEDPCTAFARFDRRIGRPKEQVEGNLLRWFLSPNVSRAILGCDRDKPMKFIAIVERQKDVVQLDISER